MRQASSLNHTRWKCKCHIVFIPKCRRKALFGHIRRELGGIFHRLSVIEQGHRMLDDDIDTAKVFSCASNRLYQKNTGMPTLLIMRIITNDFPPA